MKTLQECMDKIAQNLRYIESHVPFSNWDVMERYLNQKGLSEFIVPRMKEAAELYASQFKQPKQEGGAVTLEEIKKAIRLGSDIEEVAHNIIQLFASQHPPKQQECISVKTISVIAAQLVHKYDIIEISGDREKVWSDDLTKFLIGILPSPPKTTEG